MQITNEQEIQCDPALAWQELTKPDVLKECIPGALEVEETSPLQYAAKVQSKIGPIKATFNGQVEIEEVEPLLRYRISGNGKGGVAGFAKGMAEVTLVETSPGVTMLKYEIDAAIGGKIAQIGSRLVKGVVERMANEFFSNFEKHLKTASNASRSSEVTEV